MKKTLVLFFISCFSLGHAQVITTIAGNGTSGFSGDGGAATTAELYYPYGIGIDGAGNVYISDNGNNRIRKINTSGIISTLAGNGTPGFSGDGGAATAAELYGPSGVATDRAGNIYIDDYSNNCIRKINTSGIISTFAGNGTPGFSGDGGSATAAELSYPIGVATDGAGNVYIADYNNQRIRKVNTSGIISTFAGNGTGGFSGNGGSATAAELNGPSGIAIDRAGNVYIADYYNYRIRNVNTSGIISTFAGDSLHGFSGDGGAATTAELNAPSGIATDSAGNIYINDNHNNRIRKVNTSGIISTLAGNGTSGFSGDGGTATAAELNYPSGVVTNAAGNVYIADWNNNRIREVTVAALAIDEIADIKEAKLYPNPNSGVFTLQVKSEELRTKSVVEVYNMLGEKVFSQSFITHNSSFIIDLGTQSTGVYLYRILSETGYLISSGKFIIQK
jgi:hypothetical protein